MYETEIGNNIQKNGMSGFRLGWQIEAGNE